MRRTFLVLLLVLGTATVASAQQFTYYFPQVASGAYSDGRWETTIFITNATAPGTVAAGTITLTRSDGSPFDMVWIDDVARVVTTNNVIHFQLNGGETRKFITASGGPISQGYAQVTATAPVLGTAMFTHYGVAGNVIGEAGVPAAIPLGRQAIFVDTYGGYKTGLAIGNPNNAELHINFELVDTMGNILARTRRDLGPGQHFTAFVNELFPDTPPTVGRLQFWCTNPMVAVGVRFEPSFALFTTIPPVAIQ